MIVCVHVNVSVYVYVCVTCVHVCDEHVCMCMHVCVVMCVCVRIYRTTKSQMPRTDSC